MGAMKLNRKTARVLHEGIPVRFEIELRKTLASPNVLEVYLDPVNKMVTVIVLKVPPPEERARLRKLVSSTGATLAAAVTWKTNIRAPFPYPFLVHGIQYPQQFVTQPICPDFSVFDIHERDLSQLRGALNELDSLANKVELVVSFAAGGQPILLHLARSKTNLDRWTQRKYHLFAGLNWTGTDAEQVAFTTWLQRHLSRRILVVDTGTSGNGVREIYNLVEKTVRQGSPAKCGSVAIVGLVDGHNGKQVALDNPITTASGRELGVSLKYLHVGRLFAEDCAPLFGYQSDQRHLTQRPYFQPGIVRVVGDVGCLGRLVERIAPFAARHSLTRCLHGKLMARLTPTQVVGSFRPADTLRRLLEEPEKYAPRPQALPLEKHLGTALIVLSSLEARELSEVESWRDWGMLSAGECQILCDTIRRCYASAGERYRDSIWAWRSRDGINATPFWLYIENG